MHRKDKPSKYTWENVAIVPGGRAGLIRIAAVLNNAYLGFFIPDYTGLLPCNVSLCPCFVLTRRLKHTMRCYRFSRT